MDGLERDLVLSLKNQNHSHKKRLGSSLEFMVNSRLTLRVEYSDEYTILKPDWSLLLLVNIQGSLYYYYRPIRYRFHFFAQLYSREKSEIRI